jgi:hypothetical protein
MNIITYYLCASNEQDIFYKNLYPYLKRDNIFLHFTKMPKIGIHTSQSFHNPLGIYAYSLDHHNLRSKIRNKKDINLRHVQNLSVFNYVFCFSVDYSKIIDSETYNSLDLDIKKLKSIVSFKIPSEKKTPFSTLYSIVESIASTSKKPNILMSRLFKKLGYEGIVDNGNSILYANDESQAVFFSKKPLKVLTMFKIKERDFMYSLYLNILNKKILNDGKFLKLLTIEKFNIVEALNTLNLHNSKDIMDQKIFFSKKMSAIIMERTNIIKDIDEFYFDILSNNFAEAIIENKKVSPIFLKKLLESMDTSVLRPVLLKKLKSIL